MNNRIIKFRIWDTKYEQWVNPHIIESTLDDFFNNNVYIFYQYTGVKDKSDKEICEGDRLKYQGRIGIVEFFAGMFICSWHDQTDTELAYMQINDMEIAGNIRDINLLNNEKRN